MLALLLAATLIPDAAAPQKDPRSREERKKAVDADNDRFLGISALFGMKKIDQAMKELGAFIKEQEAAHGRYSVVTAACYSFRARMAARYVGPKAALDDLDAVAEIDTRLYGHSDHRAGGARLNADLARRKAAMTPAQLAALKAADTKAVRLAPIFRDGRRDEAIKMLREVIDAFTDLLGPKHPRTATMRANLGNLLTMEGRFDEADREFAFALPILRAFMGEENFEYGHLLDGYAGLRLEQGRHAEGLALMEKSVACFRRAGRLDDEYLSALGRLAQARRKAGDVAGAVRLAEHVLAARKEAHGEKDPKYGTALNNLAAVLRDAGDGRRAIRLLEQANAIARVSEGRSVSYALGLANLAAMLIDSGEYARAGKAQDEALAILKKEITERHPEYASHVRRRALIHQLQGEYPAARRLFLQAVAICKASLTDKHPEYAEALGSLAFLAQEMGDYDEAASLFKRALAIAPSAQLKNNLGLVRMHQERYREALALFKESAAETRRRGGDHATSLGNLAMAHRMLKQTKEALAAETEASRLIRETRGEKHPDYAARLQNLAVLRADAGQKKEALATVRQALKIKRDAYGDHHPDLAITLINLATVAHEAGEKKESARAAAEAFAVRRRLVRDGFAGLSERQRLDLLESLRLSLDVYLMHGDDGPAVAYERTLAFKGVLGVAAAERRLASASPEMARRLNELREARADLATLSSSTPPPGREAAYRERLAALEKRKEDAQAAIAADSAAFRALLAPPTAAAVAKRLPADTALVEFVEYGVKGGRELAAFVLRPGKAAVRVPLGAMKPIADAVDRWRAGVTSESGTPPADAAKVLREAIWLPVEKHLGDASSVLVAADGVLTRLPFAALPGAKARTFLIEERAIGYVTSGRQLLEPDGKREDRLLALGGVSFGGLPAGAKRGVRGFPSWPELPGADIEARQVMALHKEGLPRAGATLLSGAKAGRAGLLAALRKSPGHLHLATHGWFEAPVEGTAPSRSGELSLATPADDVFRRNPMLCTGLVLAGANADGENGYLTAEEVAGLDLSPCRLAVLSACETGLGKVAGWQGVQGLQQAFHQAGVRNVAASLWSVSDPATSVLMEEFYSGLWGKGLAPLEAMRRAQVAVLKGPERVKKRIAELETAYRKAGVREEALASRGIKGKAADLPMSAVRSPVSWWAAWQLSGPPGK